MAGWATVSFCTDATRFNLDIPASDVAAELGELYRATGIHILYDYRLRMRAHAIKGRYTVEEALSRILTDAGQVCEYNEDGSIVIRPPMTDESPGQCLHRKRHPLSEIQGPTPAAREEMAEVYVRAYLGTHIHELRQIGSPVITWDQLQIQRSGAHNLTDLLGRMTQNFAGGPNQQTHFGQIETFSNSAAATAANIRGLGARATMVLLNGQPVAPSGSAAAYVDVLQIPLSAIDRVEVLLDGASAFYGSDAVAGVINIHTKDEYVRPETFAEIGSVTNGRQEQHRLSQELGWRWQTGNVLVVGELMHLGALAANERWQNSSNWIPSGPAQSPFYYTNPGNLISPAQTYAIPPQSVGRTLDFSTLAAGSLNRADSYSGVDITPNQSRRSVLTSLRQGLGDSTTLFSDVLWSQRYALQRQGGQQVTLNVSNSPFLQQHPSGLLMEQYNLLEDLGPATSTVDVRTLNATVGLQSELPGKWHLVLSGTDSLDAENQVSYNIADPDALQSAVSNPDRTQAFDPFGSGVNMSATTWDAVHSQLWYGSRSQLWDFQLTADGPSLSMPAGTLRQALGIEYRDQRFSSGISQTAAWSDLRRQRYAGFLEFAVPLLDEHRYPSPWRNLMLSLAGRMEDYSDFGRSLTPRIGLKWEPIKHFQLNGTWAHSVRAPNMEDLATRDNTSFVTMLGNTPTLVWTGGNPNLHVEKAFTRTIGLRFTSDDEGSPLFTAEVNYFDILFRDRIQTSAFPADILTNPIYKSVVLNPDVAARQQVCAQSQYLAVDGTACDTVPVGAIVDLRAQNAARLWTDGIDAQLGTNFQVPSGKLGFSVSSTYIFDYRQGATLDAPLVSVLDTLSNPLAWHVIGTGTWGVGEALASFTLRYTKGYLNDQVQPATRVASWTTGDVRLAYTLNAQDRFGTHPIDVAINCENVTNRYSPFAINTVANLAYDQENGSLQGRVVALSVHMQL